MTAFLGYSVVSNNSSGEGLSQFMTQQMYNNT